LDNFLNSFLQLASFKINGHFSSQIFRYHRGSLNLNRNLSLLTDFFKFFFKSSSLIAGTTTGLFKILTGAGLAALEFGLELTGELGAVLDFLFLFFLTLFFSTLKSLPIQVSCFSKPVQHRRFHLLFQPIS
jgi:hypothetical protein